LNALSSLEAFKNKKAEAYLIDYKGVAKGLSIPIPIITVPEAINKIVTFYFGNV